jgi:hypothetical protein
METKNYNINIQDCKAEELQLVLDILKEALKDKRADRIFWDDVIPGARKKVLRWPSNRRVQLVITEEPASPEAKHLPTCTCWKCEYKAPAI